MAICVNYVSKYDKCIITILVILSLKRAAWIIKPFIKDYIVLEKEDKYSRIVFAVI